jgi:hypothetical protein
MGGRPLPGRGAPMVKVGWSVWRRARMGERRLDVRRHMPAVGVSSGVIGRVNALGQHVPLSIRGEAPDLALASGEATLYPHREATYFGTFFLPMQRRYACRAAEDDQTLIGRVGACRSQPTGIASRDEDQPASDCIRESSEGVRRSSDAEAATACARAAMARARCAPGSAVRSGARGVARAPADRRVGGA